MRRALVDTDILSEILKGKNVAVGQRAATYHEHHRRLTVSAVTIMEVVKGFHKAGRPMELKRFLEAASSMEVLPFDSECAQIAGTIYADLERTGQPLGRADPMIAGTSLAHGLVLVTGNEAHYARIQRLGHALSIENWRTA